MNYKIKIFIISLIIIVVLSILLVFNYKNNNKVQAKEIEVIKEKKEIKEQTKEKNLLKVDIKGHINNPGVYELEEKSRIIDVINKAGGTKEEADLSIINLSKKIEDEMIIIIYSIDEIKDYKDKLKTMEEINKEKQKELVCPDNSNKACINSNKTNNKTKTENPEENTIVNINTATKEELMKINGIGEGKAESIVSYREENGNFNTTEDIKNVSGIGDSLYEKIKEYITV